MLCKECFKQSDMLVEGNSYCKACYLKSPYMQERLIKEKIAKEKAERATQRRL